jgi:glycosyltransferase involved in cell wall biosynthesis
MARSCARCWRSGIRPRNERLTVAAAHVTILMGLRDGAAHLGAQLDSIAAQDHAHWTLIASDDGSVDASRAILARAAGRDARLRCVDGPRQGFAANYLGLLRRLPPAPGWVALADQDDIWLPDRLSRGLAALAGHGDAALYCSRTWIVPPDLGHRRLSAPRPRPPGFANALVQNIAAGNTILLNPAAAALAVAAAAEAGRVVAHDWWLYQLVSGAGGAVVHDDRPTILYRQHAGNLIGSNDGWIARARRIGQMLRGDFRDWNSVNLAALQASADRLTPEARRLLDGFARARQMRGALARLRAVRALGLYRQTRASTAALWLAALLGRM